jgi:CheY-like chemotaxis protein
MKDTPLIRHIMLADDDMEDRELFALVVAEIDPSIRVSLVGSKTELLHHLEETVPDLLFLDSFLQHESGLTSIGEIRKLPAQTNLPIVMYTGSSRKEDIHTAFAHGASAYVVKPGTMKQIRAVVTHLMQQNWSEPLGVKQQYYLSERFEDHAG